MYSYHNRNKQRIRAGELVDHYFTSDYPRIGEALVLVVSTPPHKRPVRPHKWEEYVDILADWSKQRGGEGNAVHSAGAGRDGGG